MQQGCWIKVADNSHSQAASGRCDLTDEQQEAGIATM
jgi:hypothetical protein